MPMSSVAVALRVTTPLTTEPSIGFVMDTVGGVLSGTTIVKATGVASVPLIFV